MKTEQGLVIEVVNDVAKIKVGRHNECKNCGACPGNDSVIISANNKIGARPGQRVVFEVKESNVLRGAFVVFILPLIFIFIGILLGRFIGGYFEFNIYVSQVTGGIITFILSMIFVKIFDKAATAKNKSLPIIVGIL